MGRPELHDAAIGLRTTRKVAWRLMPFIGVLYFLNFLDRTNIGFAAPHGMNEALGLTQAGFGLASGLFFIGYVTLEVPSNLILEKVGARRWIARIMVTWGMVATAMAFVSSANMLYTLRFLLGVAEAGFFPGIVLYLTYWFPREQRGRAMALFILALPFSAVIGAPLSSWLISTGHDIMFGLEGWRFMFLVEGVPSVAVGVICWWYLTDRPEQAKWLSAEERQWLSQTMQAEREQTATQYRYSLWQALSRPRILALALVYFGITYGLYAVTFFLPTIIAGFEQQFHTSYTVFQQGLIVAVPFAFGALAMYVCGRHSDRTGERVWHVALPTLVGGAAIPVALYMQSPTAAIIAVSVCAMGVCAALPTFWTLPTAFLTGAAAAAGIGLINSIGNLSGFAAPYMTGWLADLTGSSHMGLWVVGGIMIAAGLITLALGAVPAAASTPSASGASASGA